MSKVRQLKLDGLDRLRERLDELSVSLPGWGFQMLGADEPHPVSAIQVEGYCPELKKHAGIVILEDHVISGDWEQMLDKLEVALRRSMTDETSR